MKFIVSRFEGIDGRWQATQDIGPPHKTREDAEKKLAQALKGLCLLERSYILGCD
jgi:hypothetical protein